MHKKQAYFLGFIIVLYAPYSFSDSCKGITDVSDKKLIYSCVQELSERIASIESSYAKKTDLPVVPNLSTYAKKTDLPVVPNLSGYAQKTELPKYILIGQTGNCPSGYTEIAKLQIAIWGGDATAAVRVGWNVFGDVGGGFAATNPRLCSK